MDEVEALIPLDDEKSHGTRTSAEELSPNTHAERVSLVLAADNTGVWSWSPDQRKLSWDSRIAGIWGVDADRQPAVEDFVSSIHADDRGSLNRIFQDILSEEGIGEEDFEFRMRRLDDGRERWISARSRVFRTQDGAVSEVIGTARDITDQKLHDIHLHMLLREITHRSKNLLAIIQAMARQTVKDSLTAEDFERRLSSRLRGLAASHELLAAQDWHGAHLEELIKGQFGDVFEQFRSRIVLHGESVFVKPEAAQNIGLALNELATNAIRYGALSNQEGQVDVTWTIEDSDENDRRLRITWNEFGGPAVAPPRRQGFGRKVVERVAASALDGSVSLTFAPTGLQWSLRIPASFVLSGRPVSRSEIPKFF